MDWRKEGVKAGKTEGWMRLEETLEETLDRHPNLAREPDELIETDIDGWEETTHFEMLYGSKMLDDAKDETEEEGEDAWTDVYLDNKTAFWDGYLEGRRSIGIDIYKLAKRLIDRKAHKTVPRKAKKSKSARKASTQISSLR